MKKQLLIAFLMFSCYSKAQTFWTETFGTGCNRGNPATSYTGPNGTWTVAPTGTNDSYADGWFVSGTANNTGANSCAVGCSGGTDRTLHVGNADLTNFGLPPDSLCTYLTGFNCGFGICSTTHKRAQSPTINCTGKTGITLSFIYLENGEGADDDASLWYYDGVTWNVIDALAKTTVCAPFGIWTAFSISLPASADNNPNVKIGFNWINDNDAQGDDPSFAVDDINLSSTTGIFSFSSTGNLQVYTSGNSIIVNTADAFKVVSISDIIGRAIDFNPSINGVDLNEDNNGIYFITLEINKSRITRRILID